MRIGAWAWMGLVLCSVIGCTKEETGTNGTDGAADELVVRTPDFEVPPGDSFECFYTDTKSDRELAVTGATGHQAAGGHHITLYYIDDDKPVGHHPCTDEEMIDWHQVTGASLDGEPVLDVPEGLATKIPAGKQIVLQSHYINTTGATETARDEIHAQIADPAKIVDYVNMWVIYDGTFDVTAHTEVTHKSVCEVAKDADIVLLFGHEHEMGKRFTLDRIDDKGEVLETVYNEEWSSAYVSHPPQLRFTLQKPMHIAKGTRLRQTCTWNNPTAEDAKFPREMCVTFAYYFPDDGERICISSAEP